MLLGQNFDLRYPRPSMPSSGMRRWGACMSGSCRSSSRLGPRGGAGALGSGHLDAAMTSDVKGWVEIRSTFASFLPVLFGMLSIGRAGARKRRRLLMLLSVDGLPP